MFNDNNDIAFKYTIITELTACKVNLIVKGAVVNGRLQY